MPPLWLERAAPVNNARLLDSFDVQHRPVEFAPSCTFQGEVDGDLLICWLVAKGRMPGTPGTPGMAGMSGQPSEIKIRLSCWLSHTREPALHTTLGLETPNGQGIKRQSVHAIISSIVSVLWWEADRRTARVCGALGF